MAAPPLGTRTASYLGRVCNVQSQGGVHVGFYSSCLAPDYRPIRKPLGVRALTFLCFLPQCQNMRAVNDSINPVLVKPETPLPE